MVKQSMFPQEVRNHNQPQRSAQGPQPSPSSANARSRTGAIESQRGPNAAAIDPVSQLIVYALAFASRTRLPVKLLKCAWFDEKDYFEYFPLQAVRSRKPDPIRDPAHR